MTESPATDDQDGALRFRRNLVRVMSVQIAALIVLWLMQAHFSG